MATQEVLKQIKSSLDERFSYLTEEYAVSNTVDFFMRTHYPYSQALFTDDRCRYIYESIAKKIREHIATETQKIQDQISHEMETIMNLTAPSERIRFSSSVW